MTASIETLEVGAHAPAWEFGPLTRSMFVRYAGASGDFNPMHFDDEPARPAGYPSVFAQGMLTSALLATFVTECVGARELRRFGVRFRDHVWPGDVLVCSGQVSAIDRRSVEFTGARQTGALAGTGTAKYQLAETRTLPKVSR